MIGITHSPTNSVTHRVNETHEVRCRHLMGTHHKSIDHVYWNAAPVMAEPSERLSEGLVMAHFKTKVCNLGVIYDT